MKGLGIRQNVSSSPCVRMNKNLKHENNDKNSATPDLSENRNKLRNFVLRVEHDHFSHSFIPAVTKSDETCFGLRYWLADYGFSPTLELRYDCTLSSAHNACQ